jgi:hypothetical protein
MLCDTGMDKSDVFCYDIAATEIEYEEDSIVMKGKL